MKCFRGVLVAVALLFLLFSFYAGKFLVDSERAEGTGTLSTTLSWLYPPTLSPSQGGMKAICRLVDNRAEAAIPVAESAKSCHRLQLDSSSAETVFDDDAATAERRAITKWRAHYQRHVTLTLFLIVLALLSLGGWNRWWR